MANKRGKTIDTTYLSILNAATRHLVHRDYLSHYLRWSSALKRMKKDALVVDVGCGREAPMAAMLYSNRRTDVTYLGIDAGPIEPIVRFEGAWRPTFLPHTDVTTIPVDDLVTGGVPDLICSFEMLEHVEPEHALRVLDWIHDYADDETVIMVSTPSYDRKVGAADNHVCEWDHDWLNRLLLVAGLFITDEWGTFASQRDYVRDLTPEWRAVFERLDEVYGSSATSNFMATFFPRQSRNAVRVLRVADPAPADALIHDLTALLGETGRGPGSTSPEAWRALLDALSSRPH